VIADRESGFHWDDFMADFVQYVLATPDRYTVEYGGKRCYTGYFQLYRSDWTFLYAFEPTVIVSVSNNRVITAYPTTTEDCSRHATWN